MGWSYTQAAGQTLEYIRQAGLAQLRERGENTSNTFFVGTKRYFYETIRKDQSDGGICGRIYLCIGKTHKCMVGTFRIDGNGSVSQGPAFFKQGHHPF